MANFDVFGGDWHDRSLRLALRRSLKNGIHGVVELLVASVAIEIIPALLDHCHDQYEGERCHVGEHEADLEEGDELTEGDQQEEHVEEELELVVQHLGDESQHVVLLVVYLVCAETLRQSRAFHIQFPLL